MLIGTLAPRALAGALATAFRSTALVRWDINIRESTVFVLAGAGGIGIALDAALNRY